MTQSKCPICKKVFGPDPSPFCSKRCSDIDLGRWLKGGYVIGGQDGEAMSELVSSDIANENEPDS